MNYTEALTRVTALCAGSEQCEHNIREKLAKWEVSSNDADKIIDYLYNAKYLDELRFANAYSRDKMRYNHWGRQKIDQGMRLLRIGSASRQEALADLPEEEYSAILHSVLSSKVRSVRARNAYERRGKLIRFALGRGFEMALIMQELESIVDDDDHDDDDDF